ncbi:DUF2269 family protein [Streptomyces orinoci]|uniref:DUF2269 family protein n=1 Tax=Streptomyces orinoci TaxID=67339 RepID=A0ABV3K8U9_STRON|nr:DUF2269 family protein [Streptomyces orinoci]
MTKLVLSIHVLAAIILIGPATIAASLFPRYARQALAPQGEEAGSAMGALRVLHRVTRLYAGASLLVPAFGVVTAQLMGSLGQSWMIASMVLTAIAAGLLAFTVFSQDAVMEVLDEKAGDTAARSAAAATLPRLAMITGLFSLAWAVVTVLMVFRPGSSTGA